MKKILLSLFISFAISYSATAQFEIGIVGGISSTELTPEDLVVNIGNNDQFKLSILDADYGFHFGLYTRIKAGGFYVQPSFIFNSNTIDYKLEQIGEMGSEIIGQEKYQYMDIPVLFGCKVLGIFRMQAGPVGHVFLDSASDLVEFDEYDTKFKEMTFGYQAGIGIDIWSIRFDINYEGNFTNYGDHIVIGGETLEFSKSPSRLVMTFGLKF
jgi:hypothetical protein